MRLIDCFIELISYVAYFQRTAASRQPPFERVRSDIDRLIEESRQSMQQHRLSPENYDLARFAVFAWIDETILNSSWSQKGRWQGEQLQRQHYQTADAGELFFDKLNVLSPAQTEVREIFSLCLAMGFTGRYCNEGDKFLLDQLTSSNLKLITSGVTDIADMSRSGLFPDAYAGESEAMRKQTGNQRFSPLLLVAFGAPVLFYAALFLIYQFILSNVGQNFISTVP